MKMNEWGVQKATLTMRYKALSALTSSLACITLAAAVHATNIAATTTLLSKVGMFVDCDHVTTDVGRTQQPPRFSTFTDMNQRNACLA